MKTRAYRMTARAASAAATGERILEAALALFTALPYEDVRLEALAGRAGVSLQTVLRRFGSKDGVFLAAAELAGARIQAQRAAAPAGDPAGAVENLVEHYESWGDLVLRLLAEEERVALVGRLVGAGRVVHRLWVERTLGPLVARGRRRRERLAQLAAVTDIYVWKLLRRDHQLSRPEATRAIRDLVERLVAAEGTS